jgi:hypothetical protein
MADSTQKTTDHDTIKQWAQARDAKPSQVKATTGGDQAAIIQLNFPGYSGAEELEAISWDRWFEKFDESGLALLYQETTADGEKSNFNKLVSRD